MNSKKAHWASLAAIGALALAGCSSDPAPAPETSAAPDSAAISSEGASASASAAPSATEPMDVEQVKAEAIASGRPEAAWDKNCMAWELPEASTHEQEWANEVATVWLSAREAECPDQLVFPGYYVESFGPGDEGEIVFNLDPAIVPESLDFTVDPESELELVGIDALELIREKRPDVEVVTVSVPGHDLSASVTPAMAEKRRADLDLG